MGGTRQTSVRTEPLIRRRGRTTVPTPRRGPARRLPWVSRSTRTWDEELEQLVGRFIGAPLTPVQSVLLRAVLVLAMALAALLILRLVLPALADVLGALVVTSPLP